MNIENYRIITVIIGSITALGAISAVIIAIYKLGSIFKQVEISQEQITISNDQNGILIQQNEIQIEERKITKEREIKWKTEATYDHYRTNEIFRSITKNIFNKSKNGSDYTDYKFDHDVVCLLNYFESIAVGVNQGIYNEDMMKDYLNESIYKSVKIFILGESGEIKGRTWVANKGIIKPGEQPFLMELYTKWFPIEQHVNYQDPQV